jgi:hypothetical protein
VKFGKVKFPGKIIGSIFKFKMFKRTVLPRSISRLESLNFIGSLNLFSHFNKLQFGIGAVSSGFKTNKKMSDFLHFIILFFKFTFFLSLTFNYRPTHLQRPPLQLKVLVWIK